MKKTVILAAFASLLAVSGVGTANAAPAGGQLGGFKASTAYTLEQVHYRPHRHYHGDRGYRKGWKKYRKHRHCALRFGRHVCVWR